MREERNGAANLRSSCCCGCGKQRASETLARFFQVSPSYFFDDELTEFPDTEVRQLVASRNETLRRMVVTLLGLSDESLNAVLNLACRLRKLEGLPSPD